ncbi:MAG: GerMN domain-containing protein [Micropruina sp.]|nr:GerMN domain-containing protein [Micropruina sp.]
MRRHGGWTSARLLGVVAGCFALAFTGCVAVPTSGPVERHSPAAQQADSGVEIAPVPPAQNATPGLIVEGFLHAMATYQEGYSVARQFLTPAAGEQWRPETGVEIYAGGYPPQVSESGVVLTAPLVGRLDGQGTFTPASTQYHHDFGLMRDADGQWRISQPPRGLLISQSLFSSTWVRADVCFWDATGTVLVPDPRFVQKGTLGMAASVRALLVGPSLANRAAYRAPLDPQLEIASVTLGANGVVAVDLTGDVDRVTVEARRKLTAELVWSLASLEGVAGVRVRGNDALWEVGGSAGTVTTADFAQGAPTPQTTSDQVFVVRGGALQRLAWSSPQSEPQPVGPELNRLGAIAARADALEVAAVTDGGTRVRGVAVREGAARVMLSGRGLASVHYTRQGELLVVVDGVRNTPLRMLRDGREVVVDAAGLPGGRIRALAMAPDGVRVALVVEGQGGAVLGVAAITRSAEQIGFVGWRELSGASWAPASQPPIDVGWSSPADLLVLLGGDATPHVVRVDSEGAMATDVGPTDSVAKAQLAVGADSRAALRGSDGQTWRFVDEFTWEPWLPKVQQVSLP